MSDNLVTIKQIAGKTESPEPKKASDFFGG
jgi:hypothetical protein